MMKIALLPENHETVKYTKLRVVASDKGKKIGQEGEYAVEHFLHVKILATKIATMLSTENVCLDITKAPPKLLPVILQILSKHVYAFDKYKTIRSSKSINQVFIETTTSQTPIVQTILDRLRSIDDIRDFQNEPANVINPQSFCDYAKKMLNSVKGVSVRMYTDKECKSMGLNLIHDMGKASMHKSRFLVIEYVPGSRSGGSVGTRSVKNGLKTFCLVGKGVTFDAGGLNIKTGPHMSYEMKADKTGGTLVVGVIKCLAEKRAQCNVIGLIPLIQNAVSDDAIYPGDIVKCFNGKTIEITNTDAEGRLILADALSYVETYSNIDYLFDFATLTGWTDVLHCDHTASYFTTNKNLYDLIYAIGEETGERVIGLPRWPEYNMLTKSDVADYKNLDFEKCKSPGGFMATMFLYNFVPDKLKNKWVHFDISNNFTGHYSNGNCVLLTLDLIKKLC